MKSICINIGFGIITTIIFFLLLEGLLFLFGIHPFQKTEDPYVGFASGAPLFLAQKDSTGKEILVTAPNKLKWFNRQEFPRKKSDSTYRIFCLGGSTTYGRPYNDTTSFSGWLRELLAVADREKHWEVINAGGISYASYRVARLVEELLQYEPDLFVLYSGHNEFLEERTYRRVMELPAVLRNASSLLGHTRTYTAMRQLYKKAIDDPYEKAEKRYKLTGEVETVLEHTLGPASYTRNDTLRTHILEHYRFSLERIAGMLRSQGINVILITTPSNLKDCSPFKSEHKPGLPVEETRKFFYLIKKGQEMDEQGQPDSALALCAKALQIDDRYSHLHYGLGKALNQLGRLVEAKAAFTRALDEDICPLRALSVMRNIVMETAEKTNMPWIDFVGILEQKSLQKHGHSILGEEDFFDHVHLTIENHRLLALTLIEKLIELGDLNPEPEWGSTVVDSISDVVFKRIDNKANGIALHNLAKVLNWAGKHEDAARVAARALNMVNDHPEAVGSYLYVGTQKERNGLTHQAAEYYASALRIDSNNAEARRLLGNALYRMGVFYEAEKHLLKALDGEPENSDILRNLGEIWLKLKKYKKLYTYFSKGVQLWPQDADIQYKLGVALYHLDKKSLAANRFQQVLELNPNFARAYMGMGNILNDQGKMAEAINYYARALQINPQLQEARRGLSLALNSMKKD